MLESFDLFDDLDHISVCYIHALKAFGIRKILLHHLRDPLRIIGIESLYLSEDPLSCNSLLSFILGLSYKSCYLLGSLCHIIIRDADPLKPLRISHILFQNLEDLRCIVREKPCDLMEDLRPFLLLLSLALSKTGKYILLSLQGRERITPGPFSPAGPLLGRLKLFEGLKHLLIALHILQIALVYFIELLLYESNILRILLYLGKLGELRKIQIYPGIFRVFLCEPHNGIALRCLIAHPVKGIFRGSVQDISEFHPGASPDYRLISAVIQVLYKIQHHSRSYFFGGTGLFGPLIKDLPFINIIAYISDKLSGYRG